MNLLTLALAGMMAFAGCNQVENVTNTLTCKLNKPSITNGTTTLIFPEWKTSGSAFERSVYTNYYAVYNNGNWLTREQQADGSLAVFWKSDIPHKTIDDAKMDFGLNIQWNIYKALYDALSYTNTEEKIK